jgi:hypothetical protein
MSTSDVATTLAVAAAGDLVFLGFPSAKSTSHEYGWAGEALMNQAPGSVAANALVLREIADPFVLPPRGGDLESPHRLAWR